jgi:multidrug efflux pump subunit AcrB
MVASYFLSRTVVPTMVNFLLKNEHHKEDSNEVKALRRSVSAHPQPLII